MPAADEAIRFIKINLRVPKPVYDWSEHFAA